MHGGEEDLNSRIVWARLPFDRAGGGGTGRTTAGYFIADSAQHFQVNGSVTPMTAETAVDHGDPVPAFPRPKSGGRDIEQLAGLLDAELDVQLRHFTAELTIRGVGHCVMSILTNFCALIRPWWDLHKF
jgi:hypothetical protein